MLNKRIAIFAVGGVVLAGVVAFIVSSGSNKPGGAVQEVEKPLSARAGDYEEIRTSDVPMLYFANIATGALNVEEAAWWYSSSYRSAVDQFQKKDILSKEIPAMRERFSSLRAKKKFFIDIVSRPNGVSTIPLLAQYDFKSGGFPLPELTKERDDGTGMQFYSLCQSAMALGYMKASVICLKIYPGKNAHFRMDEASARQYENFIVSHVNAAMIPPTGTLRVYFTINGSGTHSSRGLFGSTVSVPAVSAAVDGVAVQFNECQGGGLYNQRCKGVVPPATGFVFSN